MVGPAPRQRDRDQQRGGRRFGHADLRSIDNAVLTIRGPNVPVGFDGWGYLFLGT